MLSTSVGDVHTEFGSKRCKKLTLQIVAITAKTVTLLIRAHAELVMEI